MRVLLACAAIVAVALVMPAHAQARSTHHTRGCPSAAEINRQAAAGANMIPGYGGYLESCIVHRRYRRAFKECLVAAGINGALAVVGGIIGQAAARTFAAGILTASAGGCINALR
jgi:hypothetical protein